MAANDRAYNYDPIGNRVTSSEVRDWDYDPGYFAEPSPNALNQYLGRRTTDTGADLFVGYDYDADGNLTEIWVQGDLPPKN